MLRVLPTVIEPERWTVAFHRTSPYWWVRLLAVGRFKHVSAFAFVRELELWLYFDVTLSGPKVLILPDSARAMNWIAERTADADLLQIDRKLYKSYAIAPFYCVSAIKGLIGLRSSALLPCGLYRDVLAAGAEIIDGTARSQDRPDDYRATATGAG